MSEHANLIQTASMTGGSAAADALRVDGARDELSERVERYALLRKLGEGGMGVVYLAYDEMLDRRVAIKLIRERRIASADAQVRMIREAQALARLSHPNVVQVYDVGAHHDSVFVAMEYIEGNTLAEWLERRSLSGSRDANPSRAPSGPVAGDAPVQPPPRVRGDEREVIRRFAQAGRGLAAAHEAGLVHRDFKPANVLVGADGRARVVDFGLVTASVTSTGDYETSITQEDPGVSRTPSALAHELTEVGAVLGTPMYMAPEQFGARPTDARTDQFSFCVALYRALFGESPFPGDSFDQLKESVTSGALRVRPRPVRGFAWVVPILRRGLATDPADRYPTMGALLADLTRDPIVRRRQRLRTLALMLVTGLVVGGGIYGGRVAWQRWQQAELEARASEHLSRVDLEMERLRGAGKHEEAERLFEDFSAIIEYQGTRTLTSTWIRRAAAQVEARDYDAAASSLARAYTEATDPALERDALIALADVLVKQHRWLDAERTLAAARRVGPVDARATSSMIRLGIDVALARRDFGRAASLASEGPEELRWVEAVANNLARSTMSTHVVRKSEVVRLHEPERVWLGADTPVLARLDAALTPIEAAPPGKVVMASSYRPGRDQYVATADGGMGLFYRATPTGVEPIAVLESPHATSVEAADLDLDGREEIYLGSRPLTVMQRTPEGWDRWEPHPESSSLGCWIRGLKATDLDGDGRQELIASCAEWDGYDVRVYEHDDESGALRLRARTMLGTVVGVESMRRAGGGEVLVAPKLEQYENSVVFPPERPLGGPPGIYLFRLEGDALVLDERVEIPPSAHGGPQMCTHPIIGDVDGDGLDDMILRGESRGRGPGRYRYAYLFRQRADGTFSAHAIGDIVVSSLDNIDDDPLPEWLVSDLSRGHAMGWLGVGEPSQPSAPAEPARDEPRALAGPPEDGGPVYARLWERAARLREVGLEEEAAEAFERLASLAGTRRLQAAAWTRAASARASQFADAEAARLYELAASVDDPRAPLEAARSYRRAGDLAEALRVLERYGERASPETASELVELREHLSTLLRTRSLALEFQRGLPAGLRVLRPQTLELVPERHTLRARSLGAGALATYPVRWDGRELVLSVEVELRRAEYNSELVIALRRDGQERAPTLVLGGWGGAGQATYYIAALLATKRAQLLSGRNGPWRVRVRLSYMADTSFARLEIVDLERGERVYEHRFEVDDGAELLPGAYRLELGTMGHEGMVVAELERVEVLGARPDPAAETDDDAGARALVLDHVSDALRGLGPPRAEESTSSRARRLVALARLGRSEEAAQAARALLDAPDGAAAAHELLRLAPVTYLTALRAAAGDGAFTLLRDAWLDRHHENAEVVGHASALLPALADIDSLADHEALADLLEIRGDLRMHERDLVAARADLTRARALRVGQVQIGLEVRLAALAVALGDREGALEHARVVMARGGFPALAAARLRARPELRALEGDPDWERLLGPDDRLLYD